MQAAQTLNYNQATGPRTDAGKATVSKNAMRHGLTATSIERFSPQDQAEFSLLRDRLLAELRPHGENELYYFERYAFCVFLSDKAQTLESVALETLLNNPEAPAGQRLLHTAARYRRQLERDADRSLTGLQNLQTNRVLAADLNQIIATELNSPETVPTAVQCQKLLAPKAAKTSPTIAALRIIQAATKNNPLYPPL
jgi:hypothetical protein